MSSTILLIQIKAVRNTRYPMHNNEHQSITAYKKLFTVDTFILFPRKETEIPNWMGLSTFRRDTVLNMLLQLMHCKTEKEIHQTANSTFTFLPLSLNVLPSKEVSLGAC